MQKIYRHFIGLAIVTAFVLSFLACGPSRQATYTAPKLNPGFYGITNQWNNGYGDVNGEVGHQLYVSVPLAKCVNCKGCTAAGTWYSRSSIISGNLPPGVSLGRDAVISGIPTERGHWIVKMKMDNVQCNGSYYEGFEQELRFHITGSGTVH